jgi:hypothetical protein
LSEAFQCANTLAEEEIDQDLAKEGIELPGDNLGLKPLLIIWPDNDITGRGSAEALLKPAIDRSNSRSDRPLLYGLRCQKKEMRKIG